MVQTAASLTFLMNTNTGVLLNVNGFLGPLVAACAVSAHCGGRAGGWNFPLSSELVFLFSFFFSPLLQNWPWSLKFRMMFWKLLRKPCA